MNKIMGIADDYFTYMGRSYPVMCQSDEFYFFPRAAASLQYLSRLDILDRDKIEGDITRVKELKSGLEALAPKYGKLEDQIDIALLKQNMATFIRQFEVNKIWRTDPIIYVKVALIGINQLLERFVFIRPDMEGDLIGRLAYIPRLLEEAKANLKMVPPARVKVALEMTDASVEYFRSIRSSIKEKYPSLKDTDALINKILRSFAEFKKALRKITPDRMFMRQRGGLEKILRESFSYDRSPDEIFEIAERQYRDTRRELVSLAARSNVHKKWKKVLSQYRINISGLTDLMSLYSGEIDKLKDFVKSKDIVTLPAAQAITVRLTPGFLRPVRAAASYSSPSTKRRTEPAYFYITGDFVDSKTAPGMAISDDIHKEYIFITAHETFPGHHLLDAVRRNLANPVRRQIESPLFYEGWASYSEELIYRLGYVRNPAQRMIGLKRRAWRAVRAMLDVGIRINKLTLKEAGEMLEGLGYRQRIVKSMLRHYVLQPGYQLCYTMGEFEINRLKDKFASRVGLKVFHDVLLEGGQIPFHFVEKRIEEGLCRGNS